MNLIDERNEILNFQKIAKNIKPDPGEIPEISGLDIYGETIPLSGDVCGDISSMLISRKGSISPKE